MGNACTNCNNADNYSVHEFDYHTFKTTSTEGTSKPKKNQSLVPISDVKKKLKLKKKIE